MYPLTPPPHSHFTKRWFFLIFTPKKKIVWSNPVVTFSCQELLLWNASLGIPLQISGHNPGGPRFHPKWPEKLAIVLTAEFKAEDNALTILNDETAKTNWKWVWDEYNKPTEKCLQQFSILTLLLGGGGGSFTPQAPHPPSPP